MNNIEFRKADRSDISQIYDIVLQFEPTHQINKKSFFHSTSNILSEESSYLCVATVNNKVIGYCYGLEHYSLFSDGIVSWLEELIIDKKFRSQGIGESLINHFESWCNKRSALYVSTATKSASNFYRSHDYNEYAVYYRKIFDRKA